MAAITSTTPKRMGSRRRIRMNKTLRDGSASEGQGAIIITPAPARCGRERPARAGRIRGDVGWWLLQLGVLGLGILQDRHIGVGIFPRGKEVLVGRLGFRLIALQRIRPS